MFRRHLPARGPDRIRALQQIAKLARNSFSSPWKGGRGRKYARAGGGQILNLRSNLNALRPSSAAQGCAAFPLLRDGSAVFAANSLAINAGGAGGGGFLSSGGAWFLSFGFPAGAGCFPNFAGWRQCAPFFSR